MVEREFKPGDRVRKKGDDTDTYPDKELVIEEIIQEGGVKKARCRYVKNAGERHGLEEVASTEGVTEPIPLDELEHMP